MSRGEGQDQAAARVLWLALLAWRDGAECSLQVLTLCESDRRQSQDTRRDESRAEHGGRRSGEERRERGRVDSDE